MAPARCVACFLSSSLRFVVANCAATRHTPHATRHTPRATCHSSHATRHMSLVTRHASCVKCHSSHGPCHTPHASRNMHTTRFTPHAHHTTFHMPHATFHIPHFTQAKRPEISTPLTSHFRASECVELFKQGPVWCLTWILPLPVAYVNFIDPVSLDITRVPTSVSPYPVWPLIWVLRRTPCGP